MKHQEIKSLMPGASLESVYAIRDVFKKTKKNGDPYVALVLQDATGTANAVMWDNADVFLNNEIKSGDFVLIKADVGEYRGQLQLTVREAGIVDPTMVQPEKFVPVSKRPLPEMQKEMGEKGRQMSQNFSVAKMIEKLDNLYEQHLKG